MSARTYRDSTTARDIAILLLAFTLGFLLCWVLVS